MATTSGTLSASFSISRSALRQIDRICMQFESEWKSGKWPNVVDFLNGWQGPERAELARELLMLDIDYRTRNGEQPTPDDYSDLDNVNVVLDVFSSWLESGSESTKRPHDTRNKREDDGVIEWPTRIGRYEIRNLIGEGSFGRVFQGYDTTLDRGVAVKVAYRPSEGDVDEQLREARLVSKLSHPNIVPIYDAGATDDGRCYLVFELIQGRDLSRELTSRQFDFAGAVTLIATICDALHYAHDEGLVHRDIKPANILLHDSGKPFVTDFGLALWGDHLDPDGCFIGSVAYMSPEQVRGETHLIDRRSDIFGLGVLLYELLTGRRPFEGTVRQVCDGIKNRELLAPFDRNSSIPHELERICLRALSKRINDRYVNASDMAEDLRHCLLSIEESRSENRDEGNSPASSIRPRGLSHFRFEDADDYLHLVPGPRGSDGIPEIIRFWKERIETTNRASLFRVGVIYGPSGCGKSSLVHAGILPCLGTDVICVSTQASQAETELEMLREVRRSDLRAPKDGDLIGTLSRIRQCADGPKLLLVIDQFEQWLHGHSEPQGTELVDALRQCDGSHVQCLLVLRDDFNLAVSRFLRELDVRMSEGVNSTLIDLFDTQHATRVLACFGHSMGKLPLANDRDADKERMFLRQAAKGLAEGGRVAPVRLAIFSEMLKNREWSVQTLESQGGVAGIGVIFLNEMLERSRLLHQHKNAVEEILESLLPDGDETIRGNARSRDDLMVSSNLTKKPEVFDRLLRLLDEEFKLITPVERNQGMSSEGSERYALTHDFLVPSIRRWLTTLRKKTRQGRARLQIAERAESWNRKKVSRNLPSAIETIRATAYVKRRYWSNLEREMMSSAARHHTLRLVCVLFILLIVGGIAARQLHFYRVRLAETGVDAVVHSPADGFPYALERIESLRRYAAPFLRKVIANREATGQFRLRAALALAMSGENTVELLVDLIPTVPANECSNILAALRLTPDETIRALDAKSTANEDLRAQARYAITRLYLGEEAAARQMMAFEFDPHARTVLIDELRQWNAHFDDVISQLFCNSVYDETLLALGSYLGTVAADTISTELRYRLVNRLKSLHKEASHSGVRSMADWTLRQWSEEVSSEPCSPIEKRNWHVNSIGMTMVRIDPGNLVCSDAQGQKRTLSVNRAYYLQDKELSIGHFNQFIDDESYESEFPENWGPGKDYEFTDACPCNNISWSMSIQFCNWLSWRENLTPYYSEEADGTYTPKPDSNGYRLPKADEWEYACRGGTTARFCFGDEEKFIGQYAAYRLEAPAECGSFLPNPWGFFDMHGNIREWCEDWYEGTTRQGTRQKTLMGGKYTHPPKNLVSATQEARPIDYKSTHNGVRVARNAD